MKSFSIIWGQNLNPKKKKAFWIGSNKHNKKKPLGFDCPDEPVKFLGTYLLHKEAKNQKKYFFVKIKTLETRLSLWLTLDLTLFGRTMLAKSLVSFN